MRPRVERSGATPEVSFFVEDAIVKLAPRIQPGPMTSIPTGESIDSVSLAFAAWRRIATAITIRGNGLTQVCRIDPADLEASLARDGRDSTLPEPLAPSRSRRRDIVSTSCRTYTGYNCPRDWQICLSLREPRMMTRKDVLQRHGVPDGTFSSIDAVRSEIDGTWRIAFRSIGQDPAWVTVPVARLMRLELGLAGETELAMRLQASIDRAK
jgi:hypothetical protein